MKLTRILHHSVNVEGGLAGAEDFYHQLLALDDLPRPEIPGIDGHWFAHRRCSGAPGRRPGRPWTHPAGRAARVLRRGGPRCRRGRARGPGHRLHPGYPGTTVQIWIVDPSGNTIELQQDPALTR